MIRLRPNTIVSERKPSGFEKLGVTQLRGAGNLKTLRIHRYASWPYSRTERKCFIWNPRHFLTHLPQLMHEIPKIHFRTLAVWWITQPGYFRVASFFKMLTLGCVLGHFWDGVLKERRECIENDSIWERYSAPALQRITLWRMCLLNLGNAVCICQFFTPTVQKGLNRYIGIDIRRQNRLHRLAVAVISNCGKNRIYLNPV